MVVAVHGEGGDLLAGGLAVVDHPAGDHGVEAGEGDSHAGLPLRIGGGVEDGVDRSIVHVGHLLGSAYDDVVADAGGDVHVRLPEGHSSGGSAALHADGGDVPAGHSRVVRDEGVDVLLVDEASRGHVADVHRIDLVPGQAGVGDGLHTGLDAERPERLVPELAELGDPGTYDCYIPHDITPA